MSGSRGVGYGGIGPGNLGSVYFGDTGTAVTTLAMCEELAIARQSAAACYSCGSSTVVYSQALASRRRLIVPPDTRSRWSVTRASCEKETKTHWLAGERLHQMDGSSKPAKVTWPRPAAFPSIHSILFCDTCVLTQKDLWLADKGAVGCGYYLKHLSTLPYVIATGTTGGAFFAELANLTADAAARSALLSDAEAAMQWTAGVVMPSGEIPYILDGKTDTKTWPLDTIAYVTEGIVGLDAYSPDARAELAKGFESTVNYLVDTQLKDGSWGALRSADQQRSPRVLTLLSWWLQVQARAGRTDAKVSAAIDK